MSITQLEDFVALAANDMRIGTPHISLYLVLFQHWLAQGSKNPFCIFRGDVMPKAKILSKATYHKCISDLNNFGYIRYYPSRKPGAGSKVELCTLTETSMKNKVGLLPKLQS